MSKRICFVVQRYGIEVNGGAELHCRQLAEHLLKKYRDIHVLTTKAIDYMTWKDEYEKEEEDINGVHVHRFSVSHPRNQKTFDLINAEFFEGRLSVDREQEWMDKQGPAVPALISYLEKNYECYDVFIFFTYLYYPTAMGVPKVADKAIVIPTAHDEPFLKMKIFDNVFLKPRAFFFNTEEERVLIHKKYHNEFIPSLLGGVGVDIPDVIDERRFKVKYNLNDYMLYVGRIDEGKNCHVLFKYFREYKKRNNNGLKLVLMGKPVIDIPQNEDIVSLGFVSDDDKFDGIKGAKMLILPSEFESLSMVVLEAMYLKTPVIVNGKCPVLRGHCTKSNGAFYYNNYFEFEGEINYLIKNETIVKVMCENAYQYVNENYQWDIIIDRLSSLIEAI